MRIILIVLICSFHSAILGQCDCTFIDVSDPEPVNSSDLYLHYSFENNINDISGNGNDGVQFTGNYAEGKCGQCASFNGSDFIELPPFARFSPLQSNSVAFWMKTSQQSRFDLIDQRIGDWSVDLHNFGLYFHCCGTSQNIHYNYPNYNTSTKETTLEIISNVFNDGEWHLMVVVKDVVNETMKIYQDACLIAERNITDADFVINGTLFIGKHHMNIHYYNGLIDEFRLYDRVLTEEDIALLKYECSQLQVELTNGCQVCINSPQSDLTYSIQDINGNAIQSVSNYDEDGFCFSPLTINGQVQIQAANIANDCSIILDTTLTIACEVEIPNCEIDIVIPNVFTPNDDGSNDYFSIKGTNCEIPLQLTIFNRWGQEIFYSTNFYEWDGRTFSGKPAVDGVYFWILKAIPQGKEEIQKTGYVHLLN